MSEVMGAQRERKRVAAMKTGAIKQIEAWAKSGREMKVECGRNVGKLNDNVTEERMLQARIWDLSRERYKFLSQAEYEKRTFLDRQLRKSAICREITKSMEGSKASDTGGEMQRALERRQSVKSLSKGGFQSRPTTSGGGAEDQGRKLHLPKVGNRPNAAQLTGWAASSEDLRKSQIEPDLRLDRSGSRMFPTEPSHPIRCKSNLVMREAMSECVNSAPVKRRISFALDKKAHCGRQRPPTEQRLSVKPTDDPRYQLLERCLCEKWSRKGVFVAPEVAGVIKSNPSLYIPPKRGKDRKSSIAVKFLKMLAEQGWVF